MKRFLFALLALLISTQAQAIHVISPAAHIDIKTEKVTEISGPIDPQRGMIFELKQLMTTPIPGDRIILIDSVGGYVNVGRRMIDAMLMERAALGTKMVCVVTREADSMAFNFLSFCDVRLSVANATFLFHKVEGPLPDGIRSTPQNLRRLAKDLEHEDEPYKQQNMKMLHMSSHDYDLFADEETIWRAEILVTRGYLDGIAVITP